VTKIKVRVCFIRCVAQSSIRYKVKIKHDMKFAKLFRVNKVNKSTKSKPFFSSQNNAFLSNQIL